MRAVSRVTARLLSAALAFAPAVALAQQTTPTNNSAASDAVGPPQLQNFSLPGTVTRPADRPATTAPATSAPTTTTTQAAPRPETPATRSTARLPAPRTATPAERRTSTPAPRVDVPAATSVAPTISAPVATPPLATATPQPSFSPPSQPQPAASSRPSVPFFAWLLAALALGISGAFLFRRNRARHAYAGADVDQYVAPEVPPAPVPAARPAPAAPPPGREVPPAGLAPVPQAPAALAGIVSTRIRPRLEVGFTPVRCVLDNERATIDFELELVNTGSAPARDIFIDATGFNAGPTQDQLIGSFFETRREQRHPVDAVPPLNRTVVPLQLMMPRDQLQPYELGGQQVFVPLVAFNVAYGWNGGSGQTSASYLLGRATNGGKVAPFAVAAGPRIFRNLAARALPTAVTK